MYMSMRIPWDNSRTSIKGAISRVKPMADSYLDSVPTPSPPHPNKLFVETTTRCNLQCAMCVKQAAGSQINEVDMPMTTFQRLEPLLPGITTLILNGIGEPLLHPELEQMARLARRRMAPDACVGFQTNGLLMDRPRAVSLVTAGINRICISVDGANADTFRQIRGGEILGVQQAFDALAHAIKHHSLPNHPVQVGMEFVLSTTNMAELPQTLQWAARQGASFAIVTHMIAYKADDLDHVAYDQNTDAAVQFYRQMEQEARSKGIDINRYLEVRWKYHHSEEEQRIVDFVDDMLCQAASMDIFFHLRHLMDRNDQRADRLNDLFVEARRVAAEHGIDLLLPAAAPRADKRCDFMESGSMFVAANGDVHPCYFLWHRYTCHVAGWQKQVAPKVFGNVREEDPLTLWRNGEYSAFRNQVLAYDYPLCSNCSLAPCDYVEIEPFEQDCYTNTIPCCDCQWCLGVFHCMQ